MPTIKTVHGTENRKVVSKEEWLAARMELLKAEKEMTRRNDELTRQRLALPWVKLDKEYHLDTEEGKATLADLFKGRSQLLIYHFMFGPDFKAGCASCSAIADGFNAVHPHLANHDVMLWAVSRAPLEKLKAYKQRMGWRFPWASSLNSDFNYDFHVSFTEEEQREGLQFNYQREPAQGSGNKGPAIPAKTIAEGPATAAALSGVDVATYARDRMGLSAFALEEGIIYHTYSTYSRGVDAIWSVYPWLDRSPKGRNETGYWWKRHDEYGSESPNKGDSNNCCH